MTISQIITAGQIRCGESAGSKKRALETVSELLANNEPELSARTVFDGLCARERLGSTGLGCGVALPHARVPGLSHAVGALLKLECGVDYDAPDGEMVDLVFGLLVPEDSNDEHLQILATLAEAFGDGTIRTALRTTDDPNDAFDILTRSVLHA